MAMNENGGKRPFPFSALFAIGVFAVVMGALFVPECGAGEPAGVATTGGGQPVAEYEEPAPAALGYALRFPESFNPALAMRDDLGISLVIAIDVSGSMRDGPKTGGAEKFRQGAAALLEVCDLLERLVAEHGGDYVLRVGIVKFNSVVGTVMPLTTLDAAAIARIRELAGSPGNFAPGGETAIGGAIEMGVGMLAQSGTLMRSLIVISDGMNTAGVHPSEALAAVYANRNTATTAEYPVRTNTTLISFIGFDLAGGVFAPFAELGARVSSAQDRAELVATIENLLLADITKLEAPSLDGGQ